MFSSCATVRVCKWLQLIYLSWQSAPCLVAYPIVSAATKELSESVLQAASVASKGILLFSQWHCIRILHYSLSPATCHPVQCRVNMRVADCPIVWVCKCLQLICLSALHLTLFDIYSTNVHSIKKNMFQSNESRVCLSAMAIYEGLEFLWTFWFAKEHHKWWDWGPLGNKQVGLVQIMGATGKNCWEAVESGNGKA